MKNEFCPELNAAIDRKTETDAALLRLRLEVCAGTIPYSISAILSAMEDCDDAMEGVWQTFKPAVLTQVPKGLVYVNASGDDVRKDAESVGFVVEDARVPLKAAG